MGIATPRLLKALIGLSIGAGSVLAHAGRGQREQEGAAHQEQADPDEGPKDARKWLHVCPSPCWLDHASDDAGSLAWVPRRGRRQRAQ